VILRAAPLVLAAAFACACGKEGPPLPPLVRLPAAPADPAADRRGASVDVRLVVPSANTDGTRPADVERVEVFAITAPASVTDDQLIKLGTVVGRVDVKAPRDPDATVDPDEPASDAEPPEGSGLDQGAIASLTERLTESAFRPVELSGVPSRSANQPPGVVPLAGPPPVPPSRVYAGVGVSTRGRRGPFSARAAAPLAPSPRPVPKLEVTYDEAAITVAWEGPPPPRPIQGPPSGEVLPATLIGWSLPATAYNVYEAGDPAETRLTDPAIAETRYEDRRIEWGVERCYRVRVAQMYDKVSLESDGSPVVCVTPADTFAPKPPAGIQAVPSEGAISLIWQRGDEKDLAGFIVLRASPPSATLTPVTPAPIQEPSFTDKVAPGVRYVYAVQAVDKAGNLGEPSGRTEPIEAR
jgi:hypothetical protein